MVNTANNKRRRESQQRIKSAFIRQLQHKELNQISVTEICAEAKINRTTFYANYNDTYDLAARLRADLEAEVMSLYADEMESRKERHNFLKLFRHIYENQILFNTYFKLLPDGQISFFGYDEESARRYYDNRHIDYHIAFFGYGLTAVIRKWLRSGCKETPEEIFAIIKSEYEGRIIHE